MPLRTDESGAARKPERQIDADPYVGLNFQVRASFRRRFRQYCEDHGLSQVEALTLAFAALKNSDRKPQ